MKAYSLDLRQKILHAYLNGEGSMRELATRFKVSFRFVWGLISRFRHTGSYAPKPRGGNNPPRIPATEHDTLRRLVAQHPDATLAELCDLFTHETQIRLSTSSMHRTLAKLRLTRKKKTFHATEQDSPAVQQPRQAYRQTIEPIPARDLIFIDEAGVNIAMARPYARSLQGTRAHATKPCNKGKNITMLGALSLDGLTASMTIEGSTDTDIFFAYVQEILCPSLRPGRVVILDNLKPHKADGVREAIESVGAKIEYLPPYSPDFSPIEECWSKVKASIRGKAARTYEALNRAITQAFNSITSDDVQGWFSHCGYVAQ